MNSSNDKQSWSTRPLIVFYFATSIFLVLVPLYFFFEKTTVIDPGKTATVLFSTPVLKALLNSLLFSLTSALLSVATAFFTLWLLWRFELSSLLRSLSLQALVFPYLMPPFFFGMGWLVLAAPEVGILSRYIGGSFYGLAAATLCFASWNVSLATLTIQPFFERLNASYEEAAWIFGASKRQTFQKITLKLARPFLFSALQVTFLTSLAAFGVPSMLASPDRKFLLTTKIYQAIKGGGNFTTASVLAFLLFAIAGLAIAILARLNARCHYPSSAAFMRNRRSKLLAYQRALIELFLVCLLIALTGPCLAIFLRSFSDGARGFHFTMANHQSVIANLADFKRPILNSLLVSSCATLAAVFLSISLAFYFRGRSPWLAKIASRLFAVSFSIPGAILALAYFIFFAGDVANSLLIFVLAYFTKYYSGVEKTIQTASAKIPYFLDEAAMLSGAGPLRRFRSIFLPLIMPALLGGFLIGFTPMLSELNMSALLTGPGTETLGALVFRLQEYSDPSASYVLATWVVLLVLVLKLIAKLLRSRGLTPNARRMKQARSWESEK